MAGTTDEPGSNKVGDFYVPKATVKYATFAGLQGGAFGTLVATIQTALGKHNKGATGVFTRYSGTIGFFGECPSSSNTRSCEKVFMERLDIFVWVCGIAAMGFTFAATEAIVANTREKDDPLNGVAGGCAAGFLAGLRGTFDHLVHHTVIQRINIKFVWTVRSIPVAFASCAFLGTAVGVYDRTGRIAGEKRDRESPESWEERRKRFFKQKPPTEIPVSSAASSSDA